MVEEKIKKETEKKEKSPKNKFNNKIAIIRIRGSIRVSSKIKDTLKMLNLNKVNTCVVLEENPINKGMVMKVKDYTTWGNLDSETEKLLLKKSNGKKDNIFRLNPPKGGFERKGIKQPFRNGGALGNRKDKINELIKKMV
jgi:large subunit ribosomal protein L30